MIAFRNLLIHGYFAIDPVIVWGVVEKNIMPLLKALRVNAESQWGQTRLILILRVNGESMGSDSIDPYFDRHPDQGLPVDRSVDAVYGPVTAYRCIKTTKGSLCCPFVYCPTIEPVKALSGI